MVYPFSGYDCDEKENENEKKSEKEKERKEGNEMERNDAPAVRDFFFFGTNCDCVSHFGFCCGDGGENEKDDSDDDEGDDGRFDFDCETSDDRLTCKGGGKEGSREARH